MTKKQITPRGRKSSTASGASRAKKSTTSTRAKSTTKASSSRAISTRSKSSRTTIQAPPPPQETELPPLLKRLLEDPDAIKDLTNWIPSWADEVLGILLVGAGAVAFASLLGTGAEGELSSVVAETLRQGFGDGSYLVALMVLFAGLMVFLPKIGLKITLGWGKIIALELGFVAVQGLLHATAFEPESYDLARDGEGGGYVGWGITSLLDMVMSEPFNIAFLAGLLFLSVHWLLGIGRQEYRGVFQWISHQIQAIAFRLDPEPAPFSAPVSDQAYDDYQQDEYYTDRDYYHEEFEDPNGMREQTAEPLPIPMARQRSATTTRQGRPSLVQRDDAPQGRTAPPPNPRQQRASSVSMAAAIAPEQPSVRTPVPSPSQPVPAQHHETDAAIHETQAPENDFGDWVPPVINTASSRRKNKTSTGNGSKRPSSRRVNTGSSRGSSSRRTTSSRRRDGTLPSVTERPTLMINGQEVSTTPIAEERQSIVPRQAEAPRPAVLGRQNRSYKGGRENDPSRRYFTVDDFAERKKVGKRNDELPPFELLGDYDLHKPSEQEINANATIIENTLYEFDIDADVIDVKVGPVVTQYAVSPIKEVIDPQTNQVVINRVRVDKITNLQGDLSLALSAKTLRIEAPVPGHSYVGIEVPNKQPSTVGLRPVMESERFYDKRKTPLCLPLGRDVSGEATFLELASLPHLLIAGTTGSGKSVCLTSLVTSLVMNYTPDDLKLIMLDPKRVELTRFNGLPHLIGPVETEAERIVGVLRWTAREMDRRYKLMELENARNIGAYNDNLGRSRKDERLPYMVLVFDEIGDLMMSHPDETETTITRLAQKARAAGIHLVVATQRPSTDVLTGLIKANFPGRISFAVASGVDSRVILDYTGAETLLGRGDMLYLAPDAAGPKRVQGCFVSDEELEETVMYWRNWHEEQIAEGVMERPGVAPWERGLTRLEAMSEHDPMIEEAIKVVCDAGEASTSMIQRRLGIGYPRAARLMDSLYELGVIGPPKAGGRARDVRVNSYKQALKHMNKNRKK